MEWLEDATFKIWAWDEDQAQWLECLPSLDKGMGVNPSTTARKERKKDIKC